MKNLIENNIPVASSCGGEAVCGKCQVQIIKGRDNLSTPGVDEARLLESLKLPSDIRISCQVFVHDTAEITTDYW